MSEVSASGTLVLPQHSTLDSGAGQRNLEDEPAPVEASERLLRLDDPQRYELRDRVGAGSIGLVTRALDRQLDREVALKELQPEHGTNHALERRFIREARITARLEHPGIAPVHELGRRDDGSAYYTMRLVSGRTLAVLMGPTLEARLRLVPAFLNVVNAVAYAHERGVVHRDLKAENVVIGEHGETVVLDWGLAKDRGRPNLEEPLDPAVTEAALRAALDSAHDTVAGVPIGTPATMSPEQAAGDLAAVDERSDVWSLGAMLYQLLTGQPPFTGKSALEVVRRVRTETVRPPSELEPGCPPALASIAMRALQRDPAARYPHASALAEDVDAFLAGRLVSAHRYTTPQLVRRFVLRHRWAAVLVLLVVSASTLAWWTGREATRAAAERQERHRIEEKLARVGDVLAQARREPKPRRWIVASAYRLVALKEAAVERRLVEALADPAPDVRSIAARALGGMGGDTVVPALITRLRAREESSLQVLVDVIDALAALGDPRAEGPVAQLRSRAGVGSWLWKQTEHSYRLIPLPPLSQAGSGLTAQEWLARGQAQLLKATRDSELELALGALDHALDREPQLLKARLARAEVRLALGHLVEARSDLAAALAVAPEDAELLDSHGLVLRALGWLDDALAALDRVVASKRLGARGLRDRARVRLDRRELVQAATDLWTALELEPTSAVTHLHLGHVARERGEGSVALQAYARALELAPDMTTALLARSEVFAAQGQWAAASAELDLALSERPELLLALDRRAWLAQRRGARAAALRDLDRMKVVSPNSSAWPLARALDELLPRGDTRGALTALEDAVAREPSIVRREELRSMALSLATHLADQVALTRLAPPRQVAGLGGFGAALLASWSGDGSLTELSHARRSNADLCQVALVEGARATSADDREHAWRRAELAQRPLEPACRLAAWLAARTAAQ